MVVRRIVSERYLLGCEESFLGRLLRSLYIVEHFIGRAKMVRNASIRRSVPIVASTALHLWFIEVGGKGVCSTLWCGVSELATK